MNEKYLIGAAIGFAAAYVLLNRSAQVVDNPPPRYQNPNYPPAQRERPGTATAFVGLSRVGIRPWTRKPWSNVRPMIAAQYY